MENLLASVKLEADQRTPAAMLVGGREEEEDLLVVVEWSRRRLELRNLFDLRKQRKECRTFTLRNVILSWKIMMRRRRHLNHSLTLHE